MTAYLLAQTIVTPLYGKLGDQYGRKVVLQVGLVVFLIGSILCGFAQNLPQLIAFRAVCRCAIPSRPRASERRSRLPRSARVARCAAPAARVASSYRKLIGCRLLATEKPGGLPEFGMNTGTADAGQPTVNQIC